ncbi:60S ribosomal protein L17 [Cyclospora cayetanensis]|uniref:Ribosomal protein rpl17 n=2 Tax=Cyclospora cayetanensis TaxID=88456 RepID=A0A1D3D3X3_9EIME|nr:60S ribosomal protein L17 [Cyclospora cayetanensis]OEH78152.1 ribosomal protein rpl17 [Cyclospora cayetanensis]
MVKYSCEASHPNKCAKALGQDLRVHFKNTYETAMAIKTDKRGNPMKLQAAKQYLEQVIEGKRCVPFRRYSNNIGRTAQAKEFKATQGRWPVKSCKILLGLLKNAEANAEQKNLDTENLVVEHIEVSRAPRGRRRTYRAHGRINAYMSSPCHIQLILREDSKAVEKPKDKKIIRLSKKQLARRRIRVGNDNKA